MGICPVEILFDNFGQTILCCVSNSVVYSRTKAANNAADAGSRCIGRHVCMLLVLYKCRVQPDDIGAHINVGRTFNSLQRYSDAERAYRTALALMPPVKPGTPRRNRLSSTALYQALVHCCLRGLCAQGQGLTEKARSRPRHPQGQHRGQTDAVQN